MKKTFAVIALICLALAMFAAQAEPAMNIYTYAPTGARFPIPENWVETPAPQDTYDNVVFTCIPDDGVPRRIMLLSLDLGQMMPGVPREMIDDMLSTPEKIAAQMGMLKGETGSEVCNGRLYATNRQEETDYVLWQYFICNNGYLHMFQYNADKDDACFPVFQAVLDNVEFAQ